MKMNQRTVVLVFMPETSNLSSPVIVTVCVCVCVCVCVLLVDGCVIRGPLLLFHNDFASSPLCFKLRTTNRIGFYLGDDPRFPSFNVLVELPTHLGSAH